MDSQTRTPSLFSGVMPRGITYCDRSLEEGGDYKQIAFLSFATLELRVSCPASPLMPEVEADAAKIQAQRGGLFRTSSSGQTVTLGGGYE